MNVLGIGLVYRSVYFSVPSFCFFYHFVSSTKLVSVKHERRKEPKEGPGVIKVTVGENPHDKIGLSPIDQLAPSDVSRTQELPRISGRTSRKKMFNNQIEMPRVFWSKLVDLKIAALPVLSGNVDYHKVL